MTTTNNFEVTKVTFYRTRFVIEFISSKGTPCRNCYHFTKWDFVSRCKKYLETNGLQDFYSNEVLGVYIAKGLCEKLKLSEWYISRGALYYKVYEKDAAGVPQFVKYQCAGVPDATFSKAYGLFA